MPKATQEQKDAFKAKGWRYVPYRERGRRIGEGFCIGLMTCIDTYTNHEHWRCAGYAHELIEGFAILGITAKEG